MVNDVSAILVPKIIFRPPGGGGKKIFACSSLGNDAYIGNMINSLIRVPSPCVRNRSSSAASSISCCPVQNTKISPGGCVTCICNVVTRTASK